MQWVFTGDSIWPLQWRQNERDVVSNHQPHDCLLTHRLFGRRSKKTSKLRVTGLCAGNSPGTGEFPAVTAGNSPVPGAHTKGQWRGKCFHLMTSPWLVEFWSSTGRFNTQPLEFHLCQTPEKNRALHYLNMSPCVLFSYTNINRSWRLVLPNLPPEFILTHSPLEDVAVIWKVWFFKFIIQYSNMGTYCEIALSRMPWNIINETGNGVAPPGNKPFPESISHQKGGTAGQMDGR